MIYTCSNSWWSEIHKKDKRIGFIVSLSIHMLLFLIGSVIFVKTAQFSIQSIPESIQVDLVEAPSESKVIETLSKPKVIEIHFEPKVKEDVFAQTIPQPKKEKIVKLQPNVVQSVTKVIEAKPDYFQNPSPLYPELAQQMHQEGLVMLSVDVDQEGIAIRVEITQSSGYHMLDQAALKAVRHWRYQPGRIGNLPVESKVTLPIRFRLEDQIH